MNDIDAAVGYWIQDNPYLFVEGNGVEDSDREYAQLPKNLDVTLKECNREGNNWASNYFHTTRPDIPNRINGRNYYQELKSSYPTRPFKILRPQSIECPLRKTYGKFEGQWFDISYLICSSMRGTPSVEDTLAVLEKCPPVTKNCKECTTVGHRVATSLIKIAAQRIFADPEQSIIELPVNSLDAYSPSSRIGKFGLGFFSILYWLIGHPKRRLTITSFYKLASRDVYCTFRSTIQEVNGVLAFFLEFPESNITMTGTHMYLDTTNDPLGDSVITNMVAQLEKLHYTVSARIVGKYNKPPTDMKRLFFNEAPENSKNMVWMSINSKGLTNEDYATGIPFEVYVNIVLQPSISTKTIAGGVTLVVPFTNKSRIEASDDGTRDKFIILVGNVAVVSIEGRPSTAPVFNHILDLPVTTKLPVSRDDVILDEATGPIFAEGLALLLRETKQTSALATLQDLLLSYQSYTASDTTRQLINKVLDEYIQEVRAYLVPQEYIDVYTQLSPNFIPSMTYFPDSLAQTVSQVLTAKNIPTLDDIYYTKRVVVLPDINYDISNGGLIDYIFLKKSYFDSLNKAPDANGRPVWISAVAVAFQRNEALYPINTNYGNQANSRNEFIINENAASVSLQRKSNPLSDPGVKNKILALLNKVDALEVYFDVDSPVKADLAYDALQYTLDFKKEGFNTLTDALFQRFAAFKGSQTYGAAQNKLSIKPSQILANKSMETYFSERWKAISLDERLPRSLYIDYDKLRRYAVKWQTAAIRNIEESPNTVITTMGEYNPLNVMVDAFNEGGNRAPERRCGKCAMFLANLLEQSRDYIEFSRVVLALNNKLMTLLKDVRISDIEKLVNHVLGYVRINKFAVSERDLTNSWTETLDVSLIGVQLSLIYNDAKLWVDYNSLTEPLAVGVPNEDIEGAYTFTTNAMIQYSFSHELPTQAKELNKTFQAIEKYVPPQRNPLQLIEIAVNEGTTKSPIDAVMTELTQNSIDAIRESKTSVYRINLNLKTTADRDKLIFSITDFVGLTATAFLYIGIPFLSTKTPSELVTGEMGSGFFNVYRESEEVNIYSQHGVDLYESHDVPLRDSTGRVIDIRRQMKHSTVANGQRVTTIELVIPVSNENDLISKASRFAYVADRVLGLALANNIYYNGRKVSMDRTLVSRNKHFELYINPEQYNAYNSYLLTKGVPFQPLDSYIRNRDFLQFNAVELVSTDVTINIVHGAYTPVQTRTRINLAPDVEASFKEILYDAVFARSVIAVYNLKKTDSVFPNYTSRTQAAQIKFTSSANVFYFSAPGIFLYHKFNGQPQVSAVVNTIIDHLGNIQGDSKEARAIIDKELNKAYPGEEPINKRLRNVIRSWFVTKNPPVVKQAPVFAKKITKGQSKGKSKGKATTILQLPTEYKQLETYFQTMAKIYWNIGKEIGIKGMTGDAPTAVFRDFSEEDVSVSGVYSSKDHTILLNVIRFSPNDVKLINEAFESKNQNSILALSDKSAVWKKVFSYRFPSSTFYHELEHARRHTAHNAGGAHDSINESLFPKDPVTLRTFDEATNAILDQILKNEYYERVFRAI